MNYYPFHIGDFRSGTSNMGRLSRWIYRDMLDVYYDKEAPLSLDFERLCDDLGIETEEDRRVVERLLRFKFDKQDDGYHHETCDRVIREYHTKAETARKNGKSGGRPRKQPASDNKPSGFPSGSDQDSSGEQPGAPAATPSQANQEPGTNNQEPVDDSVPNGTGDKPPLLTDPVEIIFGYGVPWLVRSGTAEKQARSFLGKLRKAHGDEALIDKLRDGLRIKPPILQPLEWLAAALPPPASAASKAKAGDLSGVKYEGGGDDFQTA